MSKQLESRIEDFAFDYLQTHYATQSGAAKVLADPAEMTKAGHRADGLFSFCTPGKTLFIATLHTGNDAKIVQLITKFKKSGLSRLRFATAGLAFAGALLLSWRVFDFALWLAVGIGLVAAAAAFALHSLYEMQQLKTKITRLLHPFKNIPADEQWLGLSVSSLTFRHNALAKHLLAACKQRGIGILTVGKRAKVVEMLTPVAHPSPAQGFIANYKSEVRIRKTLLGDSYLRVA